MTSTYACGWSLDPAMLINGLKRAFLAKRARHQQPCETKDGGWRMKGDRGVGWLQPRRKKLPSPARHILLEGYISHTSNLARWARKQEMKMMYIMASAGSNFHFRALYKTKLLYHFRAGTRKGFCSKCSGIIEYTRLGLGDLTLYSCKFVIIYNSLLAFKTPKQGTCFNPRTPAVLQT